MRHVVAVLSGVLLALTAPHAARAQEPVATDPPRSATPVETVPATGALFYPSAFGVVPRLGGPHFCSAAVVSSPSRDLVVTAAHCVFGPGALIEFVPLLHDAELPAGVWTVTDMYVDPAWQRTFDPAHDVAVLRVAPRGGTTIEDVVPGLAPAAPRAGEPVTVSGYPLGSGGRPITCTGPLAAGADGIALDCAGFGAGTSGGPWVQDGRLVGITGGHEQGGCAEVEYGTPYGPAVQALLDRAAAGDRGDVLPIGFTANGC